MTFLLAHKKSPYQFDKGFFILCELCLIIQQELLQHQVLLLFLLLVLLLSLL
jgi:hypothetical protein